MSDCGYKKPGESDAQYRKRCGPRPLGQIKMGEKKNPRIPRKKGHPAGSKKHTDLYTDENPKGFSQKAHCVGRKKRNQENTMNFSKEQIREMILEEYCEILSEKKDACYHKVKARYDVWPSAYASGALVKCRKVGAANWGNKSKKESMEEYDVENLQDSKDFMNYMKENYWRVDESTLEEAEYQGRKVKLGKPMQGDVKKFKVYVKNPKGNVVKVNFGQGGDAKGGTMRIRKSNPKARANFRARHNCDNPGPRHKARYWSCKKW